MPGIDRALLLDAVLSAESEVDKQIKQDREQFPTPSADLQRAKDSLLVTRVLLDDGDALDTILAEAMTPGAASRLRYIVLLDEIPPTVSLMEATLRLLRDTEQVGAFSRPSHAQPNVRDVPILARDAAAFVVREWFVDAPGSYSRHVISPLPEEQIGELTVWLSVKIVGQRSEAIGRVGDEAVGPQGE